MKSSSQASAVSGEILPLVLRLIADEIAEQTEADEIEHLVWEIFEGI